MASQKSANGESIVSQEELKFLHARDVSAIEQALKKIGEFGEVHLVVEKGRLRYVRTLRSEPLDSAHEARPGDKTSAQS